MALTQAAPRLISGGPRLSPGTPASGAFVSSVPLSRAKPIWRRQTRHRRSGVGFCLQTLATSGCRSSAPRQAPHSHLGVLVTRSVWTVLGFSPCKPPAYLVSSAFSHSIGTHLPPNLLNCLERWGSRTRRVEESLSSCRAHSGEGAKEIDGGREKKVLMDEITISIAFRCKGYFGIILRMHCRVEAKTSLVYSRRADSPHQGETFQRTVWTKISPLKDLCVQATRSEVDVSPYT